MTKTIEIDVMKIEDNLDVCYDDYERDLIDEAFDYNVNLSVRHSFARMSSKLIFDAVNEEDIDKFIKAKQLEKYLK